MSNAYPPPYQPPHVETRKKGNRGKITAAVAAFVGLSVIGLGAMQDPETVDASAETVITTTTSAPTTTSARPTTTTPRSTTTTTTASTTAETVTVYAPPPTTEPAYTEPVYVETPYVDVPDIDRAYVPAPVPFVAPAPIAAPAPYVEEPSGSAYYKNCSAAKAAGAAPVYAGDPGYGSHLDRDGDGVGCES